MKVLVAGAAGQLGRAMVASIPSRAAVVAPDEMQFDITDTGSIARAVAAAGCDVLVNAAAYTAVDRAEGDEQGAALVNAEAAGYLAEQAARAGMRFVHISTDFIFDGTDSTPYVPEAQANPLNAYGRTKLAGEARVRALHPAPLIIRTAWVYSATGNNFVRTMLRLMATQDLISVVSDQVGTPTNVMTLAHTIWGLLGVNVTGTFHCTDAGVASWYDFAVAIHDEARAIGLLSRDVAIVPVRTCDYPTPAMRPAYSVLDKTETWALLGPAPHWRRKLQDSLKDFAQ